MRADFLVVNLQEIIAPYRLKNKVIAGDVCAVADIFGVGKVNDCVPVNVSSVGNVSTRISVSCGLPHEQSRIPTQAQAADSVSSKLDFDIMGVIGYGIQS